MSPENNVSQSLMIDQKLLENKPWMQPLIKAETESYKVNA